MLVVSLSSCGLFKVRSCAMVSLTGRIFFILTSFNYLQMPCLGCLGNHNVVIYQSGRKVFAQGIVAELLMVYL